MKFRILMLVIITLLPGSLRAQRQIRTAIREQTGFGAEQRVRHPVALPSDVLDVLRKNADVQKACLKRVGSADRIPSSWFTASEINLNNDNLQDLVVMSTSENPCLGGANIVPYWVFRNTRDGHQLVLDISTFNLDILRTKKNGYRDIRTEELTAVKILRTVYKFKGRRYRAWRSWERPIKV